jgi:hypothetical protein
LIIALLPLFGDQFHGFSGSLGDFAGSLIDRMAAPLGFSKAAAEQRRVRLTRSAFSNDP